MNQLEKLIKLFDESSMSASRKNRRVYFDEEVGVMALKVSRFVYSGINKKETDFFLLQCDKAIRYEFDKFAYKLHNLRFMAETNFAVEVLYLAFSACNVDPEKISNYRVRSAELELFRRLSIRILNDKKKECKEYASANKTEKLMLDSSVRKMHGHASDMTLKTYAPKRKMRNLKESFIKRVNASVERHKDAFVRPNSYNKNVNLHTVVVNPGRREIRVAGRKWRSFHLTDGFVAKCARCGNVITSGFKSVNDYICCNCRYSGFSKHSVWTISK